MLLPPATRLSIRYSPSKLQTLRSSTVSQKRVYLQLSASRRPCGLAILSTSRLQTNLTRFRPPSLGLRMAEEQKRGHAGHSHPHNHDNSYLVSANKSDAGVRITRIGLYVNLGMAIAKGVGGYYFNSKALTADAIHSLTDLVSDVMTLATVSFAMRPPSEKFPSGYGKMESLGSLGVSGILLTGGFYMGWAAVLTLCQQFIPGFEGLAEALGMIGNHTGHDHSHTDMGPNINAAWLAGGSILIKEWLYRASKSGATQSNSHTPILTFYSEQNSQGEEVTSPRLQRLPSPSRLIDSLRSPLDDCWLECTAKCFLDGSCRWSGHISHGSPGRLGQHEVCYSGTSRYQSERQYEEEGQTSRRNWSERV